MTTVKLQKQPQNHYMITVPKVFVEGFGWEKGDNIKFEIIGKEELKLKKKK